MSSFYDELSADELKAVVQLFVELQPHVGDEKAMCEAAARAVGGATGDVCVVRLVDDTSDFLGTYGVWARDERDDRRLREAMDTVPLPRSGSLGGRILEAGEMLFYEAEDLDLERSVAPGFREYVAAFDLGSVVGYALEAPGSPIGYVTVSRRRSSPRFDDRSAGLVKAFIPRLATLLANTRLLERAQRELSAKDELLAQVEELEARQRAILDNTFDVIFVTGAGGELLYVSPSVERVLGYSADVLLGSRGVEFIHPSHVDRVRQHASSVARGEEVRPVDYRVRHRDGHWVDAEAAIGGRVRVGGVDGVVVSLRDVTEQRAADAQAKLLADVVESSQDAIVSFDASGHVTSWNSAAERVFGYRQDEAVGMHLGKLVPLDRADEIQNALAHLRAGGTVSLLATERLHKSGALIPLSITAWPRVAEDGRFIGSAAILRDMSAAIEAERRIRQSEEFFRAVFEDAPIGVAVLREDGSHLRVNDKLAMLHGRTSKEMVGIEWMRAIPEPDLRRVRVALEEAVRSRTPQVVQHRARSSDGTMRELEVTVTAVRTRSEPRLLVAHVHDVTDQSAAAKLLSKRAQQQACVAEIAAAALGQNDVGALAETAVELMGETLGPSVVRIVPVEGAQDALPPLTRSSLGRRRHGPTVSEPISPPGRTIATLQATVPPDGPNEQDVAVFLGSVAAVIAAAAERKALEQRLASSQRMQDIAQLAGGIAHDFNNMLTIVLGASEVLRSHLADTPVALEHVAQIADAGERAAGLVRRLVALAKEESLAPVSLELGSAVWEMVPMLRSLAGPSVEVESNLQGGLYFVRVERSGLEQILTNLVVNARDAMPEGGRVELCMAGQVRAGRRGVQLTVADNGTGIDPETAAQIWTPFFTTKVAGRGTGLGLPTVHRVVTGSGGEIDVLTAPGEGTSFRMWFPTDEVDAQQDRPEPSKPGAEATETVLVVDDEAHVRDLLGRSLVAAGYGVITASSAEEAMRIAREIGTPVDLLVTDVVMPGWSGPQLAQALRESSAGLPVLYVTGHAPPQEQPEHASGAATQVLRKPFTPSQFARAVRSILDGVAAR